MNYRPLEPGETFEHGYSIERGLSTTPWSDAYQVRLRDSGELAFLRILRLNDGTDFVARERVRNALRAMTSMNHPNVARVIDFGESGHGVWAVTEWLGGEPLDVILATSGPMQHADVAPVLSSILSALAESHAGGLLHLDIRPGNVFVDPLGSATLTEFGIVAPIDPADLPGSPRSQSVLGTPGYVAPETLEGELPGPHSDLYSVGLIGIEMLTGAPAFAGSSNFERLTAQTERAPSVSPNVKGSRLYDVVLSRLIARDPADRFFNAEQALEALESLPPATGDLPTTDAFDAIPGAAPSGSASATKGSGGRSMAAFVFLVLFVLVAVGGGIGWFFLSGSSDEKSEDSADTEESGEDEDTALGEGGEPPPAGGDPIAGSEPGEETDPSSEGTGDAPALAAATPPAPGSAPSSPPDSAPTTTVVQPPAGAGGSVLPTPGSGTSDSPTLPTPGSSPGVQPSVAEARTLTLSAPSAGSPLFSDCPANARCLVGELAPGSSRVWDLGAGAKPQTRLRPYRVKVGDRGLEVSVPENYVFARLDVETSDGPVVAFVYADRGATRKVLAAFARGADGDPFYGERAELTGDRAADVVVYGKPPNGMSLVLNGRGLVEAKILGSFPDVRVHPGDGGGESLELAGAKCESKNPKMRVTGGTCD